MTGQPEKPRILVVDDYAANRLAIEVLLEKDFEVSQADSGRQALDMASQDDFAVILLDVRMPIMDGYETAAELRRREKSRLTPIIFTSAFDKTQAHVLQGFTAGATDYVFSPYDPDFLKFKVNTYAQMYLRNRALQIHVDQLSEALPVLRDQVGKTTSLDSPLYAQIRRLEQMSEELKRQTKPPVSSA